MSVRRVIRIGFEALRFAGGSGLQRIGLNRSSPGGPERLRAALERLGTAFIKLGQALSVRQDLLPDRYVAALQALQDHVAPFAAEIATQEVERGLGRPLGELFSHFDTVPLAAGSVAQIHAARLPDGREVVVKIRRVAIREQIERDMGALAFLTRIAVLLLPRLRHYQPLRIVDEIRSDLRKEIDFRREARNIRRFAVAFAQWKTLLIPDVVDGLVCETVVVQERSFGSRIDDPAVKSIGPRLAQNFTDAYLHQIFVLGVFHGDPHPGNLFITEDERICFHDFGLIGALDRATRRNLAAFTTAFVRQDADWLLEAAIDLGVLGGEMDRNEFRRGLSEIIADYAALPLKEWSLAEAFLRVTRLGRVQNVLVPLDLLILMRAMFLGERTIRILDPDFQLLERLEAKGPEVLKGAMEPDAAGALDRLKFDVAAAAHDLPALLRSWTRRASEEGAGPTVDLRVKELGALNEHIDRASNRLALSMVTLGLYVAGSLLMQHSIGPRFFGEMPVLAAVAYGLALLFTFWLALGISRSGKL